MRAPDLVSAFDISCYASCPESWRLGEAPGLRPGNVGRRVGEAPRGTWPESVPAPRLFSSEPFRGMRPHEDVFSY
jgi:hypothetical protein